MKRLGKWLKRLVLGFLALIVLLLIVNAVLVWITGSRLEARLQAVRDAGDPLTLQDLARPSIPPEQNAATYLGRAKADILAVNKELSAVFERIYDDEGKDVRTEADTKAIRMALEAYPKIFPLLEQAAACPDYDSGLDVTVGKDAFLTALLARQDVRSPVILLAEQARLQIADGKQEEALQSVLAILRIGRHYDREPLVVSHLVSCFIRSIGIDVCNRVLRAGPVTSKARAALEVELALADGPGAFVHCLKTERAFAVESYREFVNWLNQAIFADDQCRSLDLFAQYIALADKNYAVSHAAHEEFRQETPTRNVLTGLLFPALEKLHQASTRIRVQMRCLRVLNALQQKAAPGGAAENRLGELGLPAEATIDLFDGKPLRLRQVGQEWIIYSVGANLIDDGGEFKDRKDVGIGPIK